MGKGKLILIGVVVLIIAIGAYSYTQSTKPGKFDSLAKCLTAGDVKMFGAYWCSACAQQKALFGKSFKYVNYVECAVRGSNLQTGVCRENNIESYPTWEFAGGSRQTGVINPSQLAVLAGCELQ
jgi:hypothetical protein